MLFIPYLNLDYIKHYCNVKTTNIHITGQVNSFWRLAPFIMKTKINKCACCDLDVMA